MISIQSAKSQNQMNHSSDVSCQQSQWRFRFNSGRAAATASMVAASPPQAVSIVDGFFLSEIREMLF